MIAEISIGLALTLKYWPAIALSKLTYSNESLLSEVAYLVPKLLEPNWELCKPSHRTNFIVRNGFQPFFLSLLIPLANSNSTAIPLCELILDVPLPMGKPSLCAPIKMSFSDNIPGISTIMLSIC